MRFITAVLETRCGCTKQVSIPYPPHPEYCVPLAPKFDWNMSASEAAEPIKMENRVFELYDVDLYNGPVPCAFYKEKF